MSWHTTSWHTTTLQTRYRLSMLAAAIALACPPPLAYAQGLPNPTRSKAIEESQPSEISAEIMTGRPDRELQLDGEVEIRRGQTTIKADHALYLQIEDEVTASGHVWIKRFGDLYRGQQLKLNMSSGAGYVTSPEYKLLQNNAQGKARRIDFESSERAVVSQGTYSTCEGSDPDWYLQADTMRLDSGREVGTASSAVVYFKGVPIMGVPLMSFPLSDARKSGVLPPTFGATSKGGLELELPYYFNIAPNRDLTLFPKIISRRGLQLGAEGRYLEPDYAGQTRIEVLPDDLQTRTNRYSLASIHNQKLAPAWSFGWNLNRASDNDYPSDFGQSITASSLRLLPRDVYTNYSGTYWNAAARMTSYQLLQDPLAPIVRPFGRLPQLNLHAGREDVQGFDWAFDSEFSRFFLPDEELKGRPRGDRLLINPQISYPLVRPGYFITPKLSLHATSYQLDAPAGSFSSASTLTRTLPTFSLDSGLLFERDTTFFGQQARQTLEPRLFYVYTPFRDQSLFPNFDSAEATFSYPQLFSENRYSGSDRISDANQLTAALTSRYLDPSGAERLRLSLGQRFYISTPRVTLTGPNSAGQESRSDLLLAASGRVTGALRLDSALQYSVNQNSLSSSLFGVQWLPAPKKVLNAEYRYVAKSSSVDLLKQVKLSGQWPLADRIYAVGRVSYSVPDRKTVDSLFGMEYKEDCWIFRVVAQRITTATQTANSTIFIQLELNGLSKIGSNPLKALQQNIPGYQSVNDPVVKN
ncbi:LPS-assembly protein LptD [Herminiimonas sp. CN]|uniref:LPS-assembly protein LptD n=1 Tax=Herminiimonas sp. CN TaxID=1349818 RepID=UPI00047434AF|nr:LPS-assembly protein LptD [Herminiimonas sp. CN]